jgi:hypothetical protein
VKETLTLLQTQSGQKLLRVRTDRGSEYLNETLGQYFKDKGVMHQTTAPYTPEQNGAAERLNRTIMERVRAMLQDADLPDELWAEAAATACVLRNVSPHSGKGKTPYELFWGSVPDVAGLRVFGCPAYVHVPKELRTKLEPVAVKGRFVGYEKGSKAYRVLVDGHIEISRDVTFDETPKTKGEAQSVDDKKDDDSDDDDDEKIADGHEKADDEAMPTASPTGRRERDEGNDVRDARYPKRSHKPPTDWWAHFAMAMVIPKSKTIKTAQTHVFDELLPKYAMTNAKAKAKFKMNRRMTGVEE